MTGRFQHGLADPLAVLLAFGVFLLAFAASCSRDEGAADRDEKPASRRLLSSDRMAYVTHYQQGLELARRFQADRALAEFEQCLAIRDNDPELLFHRARMLLHVGKADEALRELERLAAGEPRMLLVHQLLQSLYDSSGAFPNAEKRASARDAVRTICGRLGEFDLELRRWLASGSGPNPCNAMARESLQTSNVPADSPMGRVAHAYERRFDMGFPATDAVKDRNRNAEAEQECRKLFDDFPGMAGILAEHATWLRWSQIRFDVSTSDDKPPMSSSITLDLAQQYFERALDASALDSPSAHFALLGLGHVYRDMGDFDRAIQTYILVLEQPGVSPKFQYDAHFNLALAYFRTGDVDKARPHLRWCKSGPVTVFVAWLLSLTGEAHLPFRPEPVSEEHRRTLRFVDQASSLGVDKYDGAGPSAWCDVDSDGDLDLFVCGCETFCILYRNDGDSFTDMSRPSRLENVASGFSATFADYDNDGDCDLYIGRNGWSGPARNSLYRNRGDGSFEDVTDQAGVDDPGSSFVHGWSDFDRDGYLDLFVANGITNDGSANVLYHNNGDGTFTDTTQQVGLAEPPSVRTVGFGIGDVDRDGWPDLFVNSVDTRNRLYHNRGDGTFEEVAAFAGVDGRDHPRFGYVAFVADFDNDAWPDILLTKLAPFRMVVKAMLANFQPTPRTAKLSPVFYRNNGDGTFTDESARAGLIYPHGTMGGNVGDVNNDGYLDFYLGTGDPMMARLEPNAFYLNTRNGGFVDLTRFTGLGHLGKGHGITFADYDFDGDLDIYAPQGGFVHGDLWHNAFYRNELGNTNNWLSVQLVGTKSNRDGVGTRLTLHAGDFVVYREMTAGGAFGSSSSPFVHFGLGDRTRIDRLEIDWPSGASKTFSNVPVNRFIRIVESAPTVAVLEPPEPTPDSR